MRVLSLLVAALIAATTLIVANAADADIDDNLRIIKEYFVASALPSLRISSESGDVLVDRDDIGHIVLHVDVRVETDAGIVLCDGTLYFAGAGFPVPDVACPEAHAAALERNPRAVGTAWSKAYTSAAQAVADWIRDHPLPSIPQAGA